MTKDSSAPESLLSFARASDPVLRALLDEKVRAAAKLPVDLTPAFAHLSNYVLRGGKRLRGALCLLGCQAGGGSERDAFSAAIGLELFHAYLLVHDDFMDRDAERRGGPTMHVAFMQNDAIALSAGAITEHGAGSLAILFGSLLQAYALEQILAAPVPSDRALAAGQLVAHALSEVTLGQALDVAAPLVKDLPRSTALRIEELKTGSYTFELPLTLGALLSGATPETKRALSAYALPLGQAFQIADDLLGVFGSPEQTGKSAGNDLREGKRTLIVLHALESATEADRAVLRKDLGRADLSEAEVEVLRHILRRAGGEKFARDEADRLCAEAEKALQTAAVPKAVADQLVAIARYAVRRQS